MTRVVVKPKEHSCWTANHLVAHCEGYRVESNEAMLGYVEEVIWPPDGSEPLALRVRSASGERGLVTTMFEGVLELHPNSELIVVRAPTGRAKSCWRARSISNGCRPSRSPAKEVRHERSH